MLLLMNDTPDDEVVAIVPPAVTLELNVAAPVEAILNLSTHCTFADGAVPKTKSPKPLPTPLVVINPKYTLALVVLPLV